MNGKSWIDYEYVHFNFDWNWIKNYQLKLVGDRRSGMLIVHDHKGKVIKMIGYELIAE